MSPAVLRAGLVAAIGAGCGVQPSPAPVPVEAPQAEADAFVGRWSGGYRIPSEDRHGTLRFELRPGADTAYGEVEMTFARSLRLYREETVGDLPRAPRTVIDIAVVRLAGEKVQGRLVPYWDPDCDCRAVAVFEGERSGDRIAGTFTSRREGRDPVTLRGEWSAERQ
jgi:hypothetical protein